MIEAYGLKKQANSDVMSILFCPLGSCILCAPQRILDGLSPNLLLLDKPVDGPEKTRWQRCALLK